MALNWTWAEKSGTITMNGTTRNWWEGNAMMIVLDEFKDEKGTDMYSLSWFFCDEEHAKNCLGLTKGKENMFAEDDLTELTISRKHCWQWQKIVKIFTKAFPKIRIILEE